MSTALPVHPTEERLFLAACLAHLKRADGSHAKDWSLAETAHRGALELLRKYLASPLLSDALTEGPTWPWKTCAGPAPSSGTGPRPKPRPRACCPSSSNSFTYSRLPKRSEK
jgi:hypothetical protein